MKKKTCACRGARMYTEQKACWDYEHDIAGDSSKSPSDKQIQVAADIAITLGIEFPRSSKDFTAAVYWKFIKDNIEEARSYWNDDEARGGGFYDDLMYFSPINQ